MRLISRSRASLAFLPVVLLVAALLAVGSASAASKTVNGSVGPGFTISLTQGGKKVTKLKPTTYKFTVKDNSSQHNFHLSGPGYNKAITSVKFKGTKSVTIKLRKGTYRFMCDPHSSTMNGSFKAG